MRNERVTYVQRFHGTGMLCKEVVSGAVWSLTGPQILGRPTTYQGTAKLSSCKQRARPGGGLWLHTRDFGPRCAQLAGGVMLGNREKAPYSSGKQDGPGRVSVPRGTGREGMEENSWCLSQHLPFGGSQRERLWDLRPHGDSAEPQLGCVCRAQLRAGLTHEGRFPLQQHQPQ